MQGVGLWRTPALHPRLTDCCRSSIGFRPIGAIGSYLTFSPALRSAPSWCLRAWLTPASSACPRGARRHGRRHDFDRAARRRGDGRACGRPPSIRVAPSDVTEPRTIDIARTCAGCACHRARRLRRGARRGQGCGFAKRRWSRRAGKYSERSVRRVQAWRRQGSSSVG
jgi:hypothetical protein